MKMSAEQGDQRPTLGNFRVSTRRIAPADEAEATEDARTVDTRVNPMVEGEYSADTLEDALELVDVPELFSPTLSEGSYRLLTADIDEARADLPRHDRLRLLGFDLSDGYHDNRSWLWDPCIRVGALEPLASWKGKHGLLEFDDARRVRTLLREAWPGIVGFSVRALFEILPDPERGATIG